MRAAKAAKEPGHHAAQGIVDLLEKCIHSNDAALAEFVANVLIPLLTMFINKVCLAVPKSVEASLLVQLLEILKAPDPLVHSTKQWLERMDPSSPNQNSEDAPYPMQPQAPDSRPGTGDSRSPKLRQVKSDSKSRSVSFKQRDSEAGIPVSGEPEMPAGHEGTEASAPDASDSESSDSADAEAEETEVLPLRPPARGRRFTVDISSVDVQPPPDDECLELISKVPFFNDFSDDDQQKVTSIVRCRRYEPGEIIAYCGAPSEAIHIIVEGEGKICEPKEVGLLKSGDWFGVESVGYNGMTSPYQYSAINSQLTAISIDAAALQRLNLKPKLRKAAPGNSAPRDLMAFAERLPPGAGSESDKVCAATGRPKVEYVIQEADKTLILEAVRNNKVLGEVLNLGSKQCEHIYSSVYMIHLGPGDTLMRAGETGNCLFIVHEGLLDVHLTEETIGVGSNIKRRAGDAFGELALLYDSPRSATITASHSCLLWVLLRSDLKKALRLNSNSRINSYSLMLSKIPCLQDIASESAMDMIARIMEESSFVDGEDICVEGQDTGLLCIMYKGEANIMKGADVIGQMKPGEWVGEESLMKDSAADCTVTVTSEEAHVLFLDRSGLQLAHKAISKLNASDGSNMDKDFLASEILTQKMTANTTATDGDTTLKRDEESSEKHDLLPRLVHVGALGEGSFGLVVLMKDERLGKTYAVKGLQKERIKEEQLAESVANEYQISVMMDSDFVTRLYGSWHDEQYIYLVLEPMMGGELFDIYMEMDFFGNLAHSKFYLSCIILGLAYMHSKKVIYRDLKLENCLMDSKGYVKLADMGIAKVVIGKTYTVVGTADYLAPETLKQMGHNRAVDWWACGVLMFVMCAGRSPFDAPEVTQIYKNIIKGFSKVKFPEAFPSDLIDVIKSLCRKQPEERVTMQKGGVENLKQMPFFIGLDWDEVSTKEAKPPFSPKIPSEDFFARKKLSQEVNVQKSSLRVWSGDPSEL
eukprot:TRINITY_DN73807_c0_g1_i1.p1 TRINITY_DN73807_c0_g1~~TRINITY_DN73807_c0_g1_i1.p1  ORF type:complete len:984 (-),score=157.80 TRINITY_DN73807_c0_g1_i1:165-3116(-)